TCCLHLWQKPKADKHKCDQNYYTCFLKPNQWIHLDISFLSLGVLNLRLARSERGKKTPREGFLTHTPIQILKRFKGNRVNLSSQAAPDFRVGHGLTREPPIRVP